MSSHVLASCGEDNYLRFWNSSNGNLVSEIQAHANVVRAMLLVKGLLVTASYDGSVKLWRLFSIFSTFPNFFSAFYQPGTTLVFYG